MNLRRDFAAWIFTGLRGWLERGPVFFLLIVCTLIVLYGFTVKEAITMMNIYVCSRQICQDAQTKPDRSGVEEALRLKKKCGAAAAVTFVCLGTETAMTMIREALSLGCDAGVLLSCPETARLDAAASAGIFAAYMKQQKFDLIVTSCYAVDSDAIQTGLLLGAKLGLAAASYVEDMVGVENHSSLIVKRKVETGSCRLLLPLPCLVSALPKPNQPLYMTPMEIARAYRTEIPVVPVDTLLKEQGLPAATALTKVQVLSSAARKPRSRGHVLTVSTAEAVHAIMDTMLRSHILN